VHSILVLWSLPIHPSTLLWAQESGDGFCYSRNTDFTFIGKLFKQLHRTIQSTSMSYAAYRWLVRVDLNLFSIIKFPSFVAYCYEGSRRKKQYFKLGEGSCRDYSRLSKVSFGESFTRTYPTEVWLLHHYYFPWGYIAGVDGCWRGRMCWWQFWAVSDQFGHFYRQLRSHCTNLVSDIAYII